MDLCSSCLEIIQWILEPMSSGTYEWRGVEKTTSLRETCTTCQLCKFIFDNLQLPLLRDVRLHLHITKWRSRIVSEQDLRCMCTVGFSSEDGDYVKSRESMQFALWADEGSPASETLVTRPPILNERLKDVCSLTHHFLSNCSLHHASCSAVKEAHLPTRVLEVTGSLEAPSVKLIETNGMKGSYCALSHCWGTQEEHPPKTTRTTLQDHLTGIPLEQLPKTFRDAVMLVRGIGIKFVWIDSLCIIQLDPDWDSEAKDMGRIYRDATLVIAAAGAKDSKQGLFITEPSQTSSIRLPYILDGVKNDSFNISLLSWRNFMPTEGPLYKRAWAFQEWYLAQRLVFFMPGGMSWKCAGSTLYERGELNNLGLFEQNSWLNLLESYTEKKLTYHTDRLHALRGIITELQKDRQDRFLFNYGVWEGSLLEQILWRRAVMDASSKPLEVPTWSWAANGDAKLWLLKFPRGTVEYIPEVCKLISSGSLVAAGQTLSLTWALRCFTNMAYDNSDFSIDSSELTMLPGWGGDQDSPAYLLWDDTSDEIIMGIAVFDRDPIYRAKCFLVASTERPSYKPSNSEDSSNDSERTELSEADEELNVSQHDDKSCEINSKIHLSDVESSKSSNNIDTDRDQEVTGENEDPRTANINGLSDSEYGGDIELSQLMSLTSNKSDSQMQEIDDLDSQYNSDVSGSSSKNDDWIISRLLHLSDTMSHVYWALLLEPVGEGKFKRVGVAMLYPHAYEVSTKEFAEFEIV